MKNFLGGVRSWSSVVSPDEKIFTPTDERGFLPYTLHPTPHTLFQVRSNLDSQQFKMRETDQRG
ncbi:MAG: hypothetical protein EWV40_18680 [Microcystis flos-aquae Mf_WU_F_19750830_S460]|uniref:Uncharacterized protein n=1 Tax=Microcystis flos-aquae Mf_WU_F_19750830_S460 TaxID=2486237 RepID=A0A552LB25_9CHRO|nr:MAG: hypothetical protein EWV40_18680 [Microcystis flos-aquae Mf_WU_F_19750830_S460]